MNVSKTLANQFDSLFLKCQLFPLYIVITSGTYIASYRAYKDTKKRRKQRRPGLQGYSVRM